jgi:hypothetical protein
MSFYDEFVAASSLKIVNIGWVISAPPFLPEQSSSRVNICAEKTAHDVIISIRASAFLDFDDGDFWIRFEQLNIREGSSFEFRSDQSFTNTFVTVQGARVQVRTVSGQITVGMRSIPARDENDCAGHPMRYIVALDTERSFRNELRFGVTSGLISATINVDAIALYAIAGGEQPPAGPLSLTDVLLSVRRSCETPPPSRVTGRVLLSREVLRSDGVVSVALAATAGGRSVRVVPPTALLATGSRGTFQVWLPASFTGIVSVSATMGTEHRGTEIEVVEHEHPFCLAPEMYFLAQRIRVPVFPCLDLDINDLGDLVGTQDGWGFRRRSNGGLIYFREGVGGKVRGAAMNAFGEVAGSSVDEAGRFHGFIMPSEEASAPIVLDDVQLTAINDDGLAVGRRWTKDNYTAFAFAVARPKSPTNRAKGKAVQLSLPKSSRSEAVTLNNLGQIVVVAVLDSPRIFMLEKTGGDTKQREIGNLGQLGSVRRLTDSGFLMGNEFLKGEGFRPFRITLEGNRTEVPALKGFEHAIGVSMDERGTVVGRAFSNEKGESRGFRFTALRGTEDLNSLIKLDDGSVITAAICANKRGEIVVEVAEGESPGYALLVPKG